MKKRLLSLFLTFTLVLTLGITPAFAAFATATTVKLNDYSGEVTVTNSTGTTLLTSWVSTLYNGYSIETDAGYAWVLLDDTQLIKLDNDTKITLNKTDSQTEVLVDYGQVLFLVTQAVEASASLSIRTSTMSAGVRGTSGLLTVTPPGQTETQLSRLSMYEGEVMVTTLQGEARTITTHPVSAGQQVTVHADGVHDGSNLVEFEGDGVANQLGSVGFVAEELANNPDFQTKVREVITQEELDVIIGIAHDTLASQELEADTLRQAQIDAALALLEEAETLAGSGLDSDAFQEALDANYANLVEEEETSTSSSSSGSGGSSSSGGSSGSGGSSDSDDEVCLVTYYYDSTAFAQLSVTLGETALDTLITPTASGYWSDSLDGDTAYTFTTALTSSTLSLYWVDAG